MGLMDLAGALQGGGKGGSQNGMMDVVQNLLQEQGGLPGLLAKLQASGLGDQAASWIGKGENLPIGGDQIQALLGSDKLQAIAGQLGLGTGEAAGGLANLLPQVVDKLTPEGSIPEGNPADLLGSLKGLLG